MSKFYNKKNTKYFYLLLLCFFSIFPKQILAQYGTPYYSSNSSIQLQALQACANNENWTIELQDLTLLSPSCASQQGEVIFNLVSNIEMSSVTVTVTNGIDPTNTSFSNISTFDFSDENLEATNQLVVINTTNGTDNDEDGFPDDESYGNPYYIRISASIDGCDATFIIPFLGNDLCNSGDCIGSSTGLELLFDVPADYDPIVIEYTVTPPTCYGQPSIFEMGTVTGGGCTDEDGNEIASYFFQVNDGFYSGGELPIAGTIAEFDIDVNCMNSPNSETWCPEDITHFVTVIDEYDVIPYVQPSSCAGANDGSITIELIDEGSIVTDAIYTWKFTNHNNQET